MKTADEALTLWKTWEQVARGIELRNFPFQVTFSFERAADADAYEVIMSMSTRERESGEPTHVMFIERVARAAFESVSNAAAESILYEAIRRAVIHELNEAFHCNGVRAHDPHAHETPPFPEKNQRFRDK